MRLTHSPVCFVDAASKHKYPSGVRKREGRRAELHPEPEPVPLHLPQRAWPAHREKTQPAGDPHGGTRTSLRSWVSLVHSEDWEHPSCTSSDHN